MAYRLASALLLAGFVIALSASAQSVLRVVPHAPLKHIDPIWSSTYISRNHGFMVFDTLFALDAQFQPQPQMVDVWTVSADKLSYFFILREGLRWHDGRPVTAEDCVLSLQRWGRRDRMGQELLSRMDRLQVLDDKSFLMVLKKPYGLVLESLAKISPNVPFMMPKELAAQDAFEPIPHAIGSGPYKFSEQESSAYDLAVYTKNTDYLPRSEPASGAAGAKIVHIDRVEWRYMPNPYAAIDALINGEVDYYESPPPDLLAPLRDSANVIVSVNDPLGMQGILRLNHLYPPFDKPQVRQAILHLIDQNQYKQAAPGNGKYFRNCYSIYPCNTPLASESGFEAYKTYNLEKAKALIDQAGYTGYRVVFLQPTDIPVLDAVSRLSAENLSAAGFVVDMQPMEWNTLLARRARQEPPDQGGWNIFPTWWIGSDIIEPTTNLSLIAGGTDNAWFGWPQDPGLDALTQEYIAESGLEQRHALAARIQARALETVTHGVWGTFFSPLAYRSNLVGLLPAPVPFFWNIEKFQTF